MTHASVVTWLFNVLFGLVVLKLILSFFERPVSQKRVAVLIPMFNEDPCALNAMLEALLYQRQLPDEIHLVDDGSSDHGQYDTVKRVFLSFAESCGVYATWTRTENRGKRHAQVAAYKQIRDC